MTAGPGEGSHANPSPETTVISCGYLATGLITPHRRKGKDYGPLAWKQAQKHLPSAGPCPRPARLRPHQGLEGSPRLSSQRRGRPLRDARQLSPATPPSRTDRMPGGQPVCRESFVGQSSGDPPSRVGLMIWM